MEQIIQKADKRGYADYGWLKARYSFSFSNYYNPDKTRFGLLRVLNDDIIQGGRGFDTHPHENMEIISIPLEGNLAHKDSTGHEEVIRKNDVQIMSAGSGVYHSEYNHSPSDSVNLLQLWIFPKEKNIEPRYDQKSYDPEKRINRFQTVVSPEANGESLWINQDAYLSLANITPDTKLTYERKHDGNGAFVFVIDGSVMIDGETLDRRDSMEIANYNKFDILAYEDAEVLVIDVPLSLH